jgi:hypothetical protein
VSVAGEQRSVATVTGTVRVALHLVAHLIAEVPVLVVALLQIAHGWLPTSDDAVIAWRSFEVFSRQLPLDGQFTQVTATGGPTAFDLGPMQYFLLAIPDRIDPVHGVLWGAAVVIVALIAIAVEAAWSAGGPLAGALVGLAAALLTESLFESTVNLAWNPSIGVYAFLATIVVSLAVAQGRFRWLPVAVATASLATQCHLSLALPSAGALAVGLAIGLSGRPHGWKLPLAAALVVGVLCWLAPLLQQITGHPGNWTVVADSLSSHGRTVGFGDGLRGIASVTSFPPAWWVHLPAVNTVARFRQFNSTLYRQSPVYGAAALVLCGVIAGVAGIRRHRSLMILAAMAAVTGLAAAWTLGAVPESQSLYRYYYLYFVLWPTGMAMMAAYGWSVAAVAAAGWRATRRRGNPEHHRTTVGTTLGTLAAVLLAAAGTGLAVLDVPLASSPLFLQGWVPVHIVGAALPEAMTVLDAHDPRGRNERPFTVVTGSDLGLQTGLEDALAYLLTVHGYSARVTGTAEVPLGSHVQGTSGDPQLVVSQRLRGRKIVTLVTWVQGSAG